MNQSSLSSLATVRVTLLRVAFCFLEIQREKSIKKKTKQMQMATSFVVSLGSLKISVCAKDAS